MEYNQENSTENAEIPNKLTQKTELPSIMGNSEQEISSVSEEMPSIYGLDGGQLSVQHSDLNVFALNSSDQVLNGVETSLNDIQVVLNGKDVPLKGIETSLNGSEFALNENEPPLNDVQLSLNGSEVVLNENEPPLNDLEEKGELQPQQEGVDPLLTEIIGFVKNKKTTDKGTEWNAVGIERSLFFELKKITEEGGIPISHYCTFILQNHREVLSMQIIKNENIELQQQLNSKENELLHLKMDKKQVEDSAQLLESTSQAHLNAKQETLSELQQKQLELNKANQDLASVRLSIDLVAESVQNQYEDYLGNILPETLKASLKDTYDEIVIIVKGNRLPKDFEAFENFFYDSYQRHMESITKQQEIKKLANAKNNE